MFRTTDLPDLGEDVLVLLSTYYSPVRVNPRVVLQVPGSTYGS